MISLTSASLRCSLSTGATRRDTGDSSASSPPLAAAAAANPCLRCKRKCGRESQKRERTRMSGIGNRDPLYTY